MGGIVRAVKKVVSSVVDVVVGAVKGVVDFVGDVIGFVVNPFGAFDTPEVPDPGQAAQGVTLTRQGSAVPIPVVYGYRRVGGINVFTETNGESNAYLYVVYALCEGEIHGVNRITVDDVELPMLSNRNVYNSGQKYIVTSGRFKNRIQYQIFNGSDSQGQSSLANESASWGLKNRTAPGVAYAVLRFEWLPIETQEEADANPFKGGIPNVKFDVFGKKVFDARTHTAGNEEFAQEYANRGVGTYSFNPANCLLDYLQNPRYGVGIPNSLINAESFRIAAEKYEQTINYDNRRTGRALTMNAVIDTGQTAMNNVKTMVAGCRATFPFVQGRYKLKPEDGGNPTDITSAVMQIAYDIDKSVIVGGISLTGERKNTKYNQVNVNFIDPDRGFTNQQVVYSDASDLSTDSEEPLVGDFTFHTITNPSIARDLAEMIYRKSRQQRTVQFTGTQELHDVEVGDIIRITDDILLLDQDTYRVVGIKLRNDLLVEIEAVEHDPQIYPFVTGPTVELPPPLFLPDTYSIFPLVRELPENPISLVPVIDPDVPGGTGIINNPPPDTADPADPPVAGGTGPVRPTGTITFFEDVSQRGPTGLYYGDSFAGDPYDRQVLGNNTGLYTNGLVGLHYRHNHFISDSFLFGILRLSTGSLVGVGYDINLPRDTTIDEFIVRGYENGVLNYEKIVNIRKPNKTPPLRIDRYSGWSRPFQTFHEFPNQNTVYVARFRRSSTGQEFADGSDFTTLEEVDTTNLPILSARPGFFEPTPVFPGFTYTNAEGVRVTGTNIDAAFNYAASVYFNTNTTGLVQTTSHNLGG